MKNHIHLAVVRLLSATLCAAALSAIAAVPVRWTAETSRVQPIALDAWRGDTLALECTLISYGRPVSLGAATASLLWQTNGMGSAWWQTNATVSADGVIRATWSPSMDPGAPAVAFFLPVQTGDGASYRAAGTLRFRPSPGAGSQIAELPQPGGTLDFGEFNLVNAPWATLDAANEAISAAVTSATGALVIPPPVDLGPYATTGYVAGAISSATGSLVIPPPVDLGPYATTGHVAEVVQTASNALEGQIQAVSDAAMPRAEMGAYATQTDVSTAIAGIQIPSLAGYATQSYVADYFSTNYTQPDLSSYASRSYADAAASNAQAAAIAAIPSLAGYATQSYVANYVASNNTPPDLSSYASISYADEVASNAQAAAIAAIPSLSGYATETYAQNAAESAASDALSAAQSYANDLSWAASAGNTRLVSLDGTTWQDATGTVWQVSGIFGWSGTVLDLPTTTARAIKFAPVPGSNDVWSAGGGTNISWDATGMQSFVLGIPTSSNAEYLVWADDYPPADATNITFTTSAEKYYLYYRPVALATNPVDRVLYASSSGDAATADRALSIGTPTRWTDATGCVWEVGAPAWISTTAGVEFKEWTEITYGEYEGMWDLFFSANGDGSHVYTNAPSLHQSITVPAGAWWYHDIMEDRGGFPVSFVLVATTNLIGRVALTNDLPDTASITNDLANLRTESALVYRLYSGSNVVAEVTNYNSQVHAPSLRLLQLNESNEYITVWTENNGLARTLAAATNYADDAISSRAAPRAWSRTTSGLGAEAPANTTWISTPTTVIAGGLEYAKFVDTYGEVWVLTSNGMAAEFSPDTNAYFRITADDGTPVFSIEKSDAQLVGANAAGITVGETTITIPVPVVSSTAPTMYWRYSLSSGEWADETAVNPSYMAVDWTGGPGSWVCTISFDGTRPSSMFFKFNFLQEGGVVIRNNATTDLSSGIYVNGTKFVPTVSGNNLIWTKQ
ncbi:MAG: hypothetical protein IIZ06_02815 [Kiritimatiellae bacterium]|nr:hypothetical protein [Kiritimatiellia bacterium]